MDTADLERRVESVRARKDEWARLPIAEQIGLLRRLRPRVDAVAERWVSAASAAKGLPPGSPWSGEEWISGPYAVLHGINALERTLVALAAGRSPLPPGAIRTRAGGQVVVDVFPVTGWDRLLLNGMRAEVWMQPGVTPAEVERDLARRFKQPAAGGAVALVLGAGNVASIAPLDVLHKLYAEGQVCVLKPNPINDYLAPLLEEAFEEYVERGFLAVARGGAEVGAWLASHPGVDEIHVTGSARTYDALRFGPGPEGAARKQRGEPLSRKRITAELGGVGPVVVLPGRWSQADLRFQAEHVATQKLHNGGFNCVASQVLVLPAAWPQREAFLDALREVFRAVPTRPAYYPGAAERQAAALRAYPGAELLDAPAEGVVPRTLIAGLDPGQAGQYAFTEEAFGAVLAETSLPGRTPAEFLEEAVAFANGQLKGTLGASLIAHPRTLAELGPALEQGISRLRYGAVGVNSWVALAFALAEGTWGAFPGHQDRDIQSGQGVVHNAFMLHGVERTVTYAPFEPFPRAWLGGRLHLSPKPPWFLTHAAADDLGRRLTRFEARPGLAKVPGLLLAALRG
jgi:aldehyde dehydrogenase (NAD(P)+)